MTFAPAFACAICGQLQPEQWPGGLRPLDATEVYEGSRGMCHTATIRGRTGEHQVREHFNDDLVVPEREMTNA